MKIIDFLGEKSLFLFKIQKSLKISSLFPSFFASFLLIIILIQNINILNYLQNLLESSKRLF